MEKEILSLAMELIKIKSISENKAETNRAFDLISKFLHEKNGIIEHRENRNGYPSALFSYTDTLDFDYLFLGHIDVVPAPDEMFIPKIDGDKLYGRGAYDMKGMAAVMINVFKSLDIADKKIGLLLVGDEEIGGKNGADYWVKEKGLKASVVLDLDAAEPIHFINNKSKAAYFIKLMAKGISVHGASPWRGFDANEELLSTIMNIRKHFPYYSQDNVPNSEWVNTMHVGIIKGGTGQNIVSANAEAIIDIRLTETMGEGELLEIIRKSLTKNVDFEIIATGKLVKSDENSEIMQKYKRVVEKIIGRKVSFNGLNGATDGRCFKTDDNTVITHQSNGYGPHESGEFAYISGFYQMAKILKEFLN